jgi:hypothetical protein
MIAYLRLFLSHGLSEGLTQAQRLAEAVCAEPVLARAFLDECIRKQADPELTRLLNVPQVKDLAAFLAGQAA